MYEVKFFDGDYKPRQRAANKWGADLYVEQHFNSAQSQKANYALAIVGSNASAKSKAVAWAYVTEIVERFGIPIWGKDGVSVGGINGRGNRNLVFTSMPAVLLEPMFCSNPDAAKIIKSEEGQLVLADALVETLRDHFPDGGKIAFSIGHKGKTSAPRAKGARVHGGGWEGDFAEIILRKAAEILEGMNG